VFPRASRTSLGTWARSTPRAAARRVSAGGTGCCGTCPTGGEATFTRSGARGNSPAATAGMQIFTADVPRPEKRRRRAGGAAGLEPAVRPAGNGGADARAGDADAADAERDDALAGQETHPRRERGRAIH